MTSGCLDRKEVRGAIWGVHSTGTGQPVETQDVFLWRLAGRSAPTELAIVHWIGCINAIKPSFCVSVGPSFKLILSFYKDYIVVHRAITKSLRSDYLSRLLDFEPQGNTHISQIGLSTGRNSNWTFYW